MLGYLANTYFTHKYIMEDQTNVVYLDQYRKSKLSPQFDEVRRSMWHPSMGDKSPEQFWAEQDAKKGKNDTQ